MNDIRSLALFKILISILVHFQCVFDWQSQILIRSIDAMSQPLEPIAYIEKNVVGRDFVVGDIHGAFEMVNAAMRQVNFDRFKDRLFCVGDLIDRHWNSHQVLDFLVEPYVYAIRGNHDHWFAALDLEEIREFGNLGVNGMGWVQAVSDEKLLAIRDRLSMLPYAMQIQTQHFTVGLVHADIPDKLNWQKFIGLLEAHDPQALMFALEGRDRIRENNQSGVPGIGRIFVGHSVQRSGARRYGNVFAIDTGAVYRELNSRYGRDCALTIVNLSCDPDTFDEISICKSGNPSVVTCPDFFESTCTAEFVA